MAFLPSSVESAWRNGVSRRKAFRGLAGFLAASPFLRGQQDPYRDHTRVPGIDELDSAFDFEEVAFAKLPRATFNYTAHAAAGEFTKRRNREAFDWVDLVPRAVSEPGPIDTSTEVLGTKMRYPIMAAPSAAHLALHPSKEHGTYSGLTAAADTPMIVSHVTSTPIGEITQRDGGPLWYQLYPREKIADNRERLEAAEDAGCGAIVVTVDQQAAYYDRSLHDRNLSSSRRRPRRPGSKPQNPYRFTSSRLWYEWGLFAELRRFISLPMLAKGVLTKEDAVRCIDEGLDGIIVSNHGGRALDYSPSTLEVLPEIVDAVAGRAPVLVDGGFRRGDDILKALAIGADAVCVGRVPRWGLGAFGPAGVQRVVEILQAELRLAMARVGVRSLQEVDRSLVKMDLP